MDRRDLHVSATKSHTQKETYNGAPDSIEDLLLIEIAKLKEQQKRLFSVVERLHKGHTECFRTPEAEEASSRRWVEPEKIYSERSNFGSETPLSTMSQAPSSLSVASMSQTNTIASDDSSSESGETDSVVVCPAKEIISSMWDDFSVDSYTTALHDESNCRHPKPTEWRPQITIPQPFSMTVREAFQEKKKSRALLLAEEEKRVKEQEEEAECARKFKANPMPASAYLPLYDIIVAKNECRRKKVKENCKELLKSQERPFNFFEREKIKKQEQLETAEKISQSFQESWERQQFQANPVPSYLFDTSMDDKVKEEELYRQIRIKMRAENLLRQSKMPGTMEERSKSQIKAKSLHARSKTAEKRSVPFQPEINKAVPDFGNSHVTLHRQLSKKKLLRSSTEVKPFLLRTEMIPSRKDRVYEDMMLDEATLPETRWPYVTPRRKVNFVGPRPHSAPSPEPQKTTATILREAVTKEKLNAVLALEQSIEEKNMAKTLHEKEVRREMAQKIRKDFDSEKRRQAMNRSKKTEAAKRADMERKCEYKQMLSDMNRRLEERPFMFQRVSQMNAVRSAEGKYLSALKRAGVSEEEVEDLLAGHSTV